MKTNEQLFTKNLNLTYQLMDYFLRHPNLENRRDVKAKTFVIFTNKDEQLNKYNYELLLKKLKTEFDKVCLAFKGENNDLWRFETATKKQIPNIPFITH